MAASLPAQAGVGEMLAALNWPATCSPSLREVGADRLTARPARDTRSTMRAVLIGEQEQVDTKPPKRQPMFAHEDPRRSRRGFAVPPPRRRRRPAGPRGSNASVPGQLDEIQSVSAGRDLGATLSHGASHERPGVGWGVARLVAVRRREGQPDPAPALGLLRRSRP